MTDTDSSNADDGDWLDKAAASILQLDEEWQVIALVFIVFIPIFAFVACVVKLQSVSDEAFSSFGRRYCWPVNFLFRCLCCPCLAFLSLGRNDNDDMDMALAHLV
jgi:hypothetical protein